MPRTFFQDFKRDNGDPVTVEYSATGGEPYADLPGHICDGGGSGPEVEIVAWWPNVQEYHDLHSKKLDLENFMLGKSIAWLMGADTIREEITELESDIRRWDDGCMLTDAEIGRMETWLCEHHVVEYDEEDYF